MYLGAKDLPISNYENKIRKSYRKKMQYHFPNIRHMRVFLEVADSGSVSVAAQRCNLSQPAATQAIKQLETRFNTSLLARRRKRITLSNCGTLFSVRARVAMRHLNEGAEAALRIAGNKTRSQSTFALSTTSAQLRSLMSLANTGSFSVSARTLERSQPTVHRTARNLEAIAGVPFFKATSSGVRLTPAAEVFVKSTKLAWSELKQAEQEINLELGQECSTLVLGSLPLARTLIVPKAIHAMVSTIDGVQIQVVEGRYAELLKSLREGEIDCMIGALRHPVPADDVTQEMLFSDPLSIIAHSNHPLAGKPNLRLEDTLSYPWIAPPRNTPAGQYLFDTLRIQDRPQTPVRAVSSSMAILRGVLEEGDYVSIVSRHQIKIDEELGSIATLDIPLKGHTREIGLTYRLDWRPTKTQAKFIQYLRKFSSLAIQE